MGARSIFRGDSCRMVIRAGDLRRPPGRHGPRDPISTKAANDRFDYQTTAVSPDGSSVSFTRWSRTASRGPRRSTSPRASERVLPTPRRHRLSAGPPCSCPMAGASRLAELSRWTATFQLVVAPADGSGERNGRSGPRLLGLTRATSRPPMPSLRTVDRDRSLRASTDRTLLPSIGSPGSDAQSRAARRSTSPRRSS